MKSVEIDAPKVQNNSCERKKENELYSYTVSVGGDRFVRSESSNPFITIKRDISDRATTESALEDVSVCLKSLSEV